MWNNPAVPFYFYYLPSKFYQRLVLAINGIDNEEIRDEMFDIIFKIGRLRAKVDSTIKSKYSSLSRWQKRVLAEAVPFVVLSMNDEAVMQIWQHGKEKMGITEFQDTIRKIAKKQLKLIKKFIHIGQNDSPDIHKDSMNLFNLSPDRLLSFLSKISGLSYFEIVDIYQSSHLKANSGVRKIEIFNLLYEE
jgi:hypothetical protein